MDSAIRVEPIAVPDAAVTDMLVELALHDQEHYSHPRETRAEVERRLRVEPRFTGENQLLVARDAAGTPVGVCWVVLFDPGTGLEAELAELYVRPEARGAGVARALAAAAVELMRRRHVSFASVWSRDDNPAALAAYRAAGFTATEQVVLTWLPLPEPHPDAGRE